MALSPSSAHGSSSAAAPFLTAEITLTNAQIIGLGGGGGAGVYVDVVSAPGAGQYIRFESAEVKIDASAGAYGNINAAAYMDLEMHGVSGASVTPQLPNANLVGLLGGDAEAAVAPFPILAPGGVATYFDASQVENMPLALFVFNAASGVFTGGHAANSGSVKVWYTVEALP